MDKNILRIIQSYFAAQPVTKAWVFGSFARGDANEHSDIDILVSLDKKRSFGANGFRCYVC